MTPSRKIIQKIKNHIKFQQANNEINSHYSMLGNTLVRISSHCCDMRIFDEHLKNIQKHEGLKIISLVFEDDAKTYIHNIDVIDNSRKTPIVAEEYVYSLNGNHDYLSDFDVESIIESLQHLMSSDKFIEPTMKAIHGERISENPINSKK